MNEATLRLFNGVLIKGMADEGTNDSFAVFTRGTLTKGYILDPKIYGSTSVKKLSELFTDIEKHVISFGDWNNSFYKCWEQLLYLSDFELRRDQLIHYFTTYNYNAMGIDADKFMYIPEGEIELPEHMKFLYIRALTEDEVIEKLDKLMSSGVALKSETQDDIMSILGGIDNDKVLSLAIRCRNKELNTRFAIDFKILPVNPTEFLRYVIQVSTGNSLIIKDKATISAIKMGDNAFEIVDSFNAYKVDYGLIRLAESFYRYKPLWLAFRSYPGLKPMINKIRKLAVSHHKPMKADLLNDITGMLNRQDDIYRAQFKQALDKANSFRKIRLLYALKTMAGKNAEVVYKIRNGKSYATTREYSFKMETLISIYGVVQASIVDDLRKKVEGKSIKVDSMISYALPATEKQFIGNFPSGTSVEVEGNAVVGVHWENFKGEQTDLDLSLIDISGNKLGWNAGYRDDIAMYSGDVVNAPKGASEFFYFKGVKDGLYLLQLNLFSPRHLDEEIPFSMIVGASKKASIKKNYLIDPNEVILQTKSSIGNDEKVLGIVSIEKGKTKFYFSESKVGSRAVSSNTEAAAIQRTFMLNQLNNSIDFSKMLSEAGAIIIDLPEAKCDINLSADSIEKDTILELFY